MDRPDGVVSRVGRGDVAGGCDPEVRALAGELGMNYAVGIHASQRVWDAVGVWTEPMSVEEMVA